MVAETIGCGGVITLHAKRKGWGLICDEGNPPVWAEDAGFRLCFISLAMFPCGGPRSLVGAIFMRRLFDHIDLRVRSLAEAKPFYSRFLPAIGFPEFCETSLGIAYDAKREHRKPEFIGLIEDPEHRPNRTRIAFWAES